MKYLIGLITVLLFNSSFAQESSLSDKTSQMKKYEGYIDFYYDEKSDEIWWLIDNLDEEVLYINSLTAGLGSNDIGLDRNQLGDSRVVYFDKVGSKLFLVQPNYDYRANSDDPYERKAVEEAFATSVLWGFPIEIEENGKFLINATDFLMRDAHNISQQLSSYGSYSLDRSKSAFYLKRTKNFPENTEFETTVTYTGKANSYYVRSVTPTSSNITLRLHHSIVKLPEPGFELRKFDPRAGFYAMSHFDYATPISESIQKRFIMRHRLEKKDPSARKSEAVEPIVYYLDRGTPEPIRSALLEGASWWNQAFEAAGYINAFQVKLLPEGADPMDIRYNVINWVHRSTRGWSYGSWVADPRTGEIIKGHVTLGSLRVRQDFLIATGLLSPYRNGDKVPDDMQEMALARLRQLSAHEVGHTLGLYHSYTSSTEGRASVMDYPHPLVKIRGNSLSLDEAYDDEIGDWDKVAIEYGYQDFPDDEDEQKELDKIIDGYVKDGLTFLSDQDARPKGSAHPYAHLWDNGEDVSEELDRVLKIREIAIGNMGENSIRNGEPYSNISDVLAPIYYYHRYQTEAAVKLVGGLDYRYKVRGDKQYATEMIPADVQKEALDKVLKTLSPEVLTLPEELIAMIPPKSLGEGNTRENIKSRTGLTFDPVGAAEAAASFTLELLLHPQRMARLIEYNSRNSEMPGIDYVISELLDKTVRAKKPSGLKGEISKTVDHMVVEHLLQLAASKSTSPTTRAEVYDVLKNLQTYLMKQNNAHSKFLSSKIDSFWLEPDKYLKEKPLDAPDGSPIGMNFCGSGY